VSKKTITMCDPPSGWMYGFPKEIPEHVLSERSTARWLVEQGYPQSEIDALGDNFFCRYWKQEIDDV